MAKGNEKDKAYTIIGGIVFAIVAVVAMLIANSQPQIDEPPAMSVSEAQIKCMLMEEADLVNLNGEKFGDETTKKAEEFCLASWDRKKNPENTEEKFIETVSEDWETRKTEVLEGYTLEEYFNEYSKDTK